MEQSSGNHNISSLTLSRRCRAFPDSFVYSSYSRYLVYENRAGHESRHVGLLPDSRNLVYYCDFSTCRIFSYAHKNAQSWLLQGPIQFMDVGNFILAGDSIEIRESSLLMQFLAAGDVCFGFGSLNIIWNILWCIDLWWVTHYPAWTPTDFKESAHSARTHSQVKTWAQAQCILTHQKLQ